MVIKLEILDITYHFQSRLERKETEEIAQIACLERYLPFREPWIADGSQTFAIARDQDRWYQKTQKHTDVHRLTQKHTDVLRLTQEHTGAHM